MNPTPCLVTRLAWVGAVIFTVLGLNPLQGQTVVVNNLANTSPVYDGSNQFSSSGQAFVTGNSAGGFTINSISIKELTSPQLPDPNVSSLSLSIYSNAGSSPGTALFTLTSVPATNQFQTVVWTPSSPITLAGSTTYWLVLSEGGSGGTGWGQTSDSTFSATNGWSIPTGQIETFSPGAGMWFSPTGLTVGATLQFSITATAAPTPEPSTWALVLLGTAGLYLFRRQRRCGEALPA